MNISNLICNTYIEKKFSSENITQWAHLMHEEKNIMNKKKFNCITLFLSLFLFSLCKKKAAKKFLDVFHLRTARANGIIIRASVSC